MVSIMSDIELNSIFTLKTDPNIISDSGVEEIRKFMKEINFRNPEWRSILPAGYDPYDYAKDRIPALPDNWAWVANLEKKQQIDGKSYSGRFTRRYSSFVYAQMGLKLPNSWLEKLGNLVSQHSENSPGYQFDFTDNLNSWNAGDFGDHGSCFWGGRESARKIMKRHGVMAVRFYKSSDTGLPVGCARAWIVPDYPKEGLLTVFNGYGFQGDPTKIIARVLAEFFKVENYVDIRLRNNDNTDGVVYINGGRCFLLGSRTITERTDHIDFHWKEKLIGNCIECDCDLYDNGYQTFEHRRYCQDCYDEHIQSCEYCHNPFRSADAEIVEDRTNGSWIEVSVCPGCYRRNVSACESCARVALNTHIAYVPIEGIGLCVDCYEEDIAPCDRCNTAHRRVNLLQSVDDTGNEYCEVCAEDIREELAE